MNLILVRGVSGSGKTTFTSHLNGYILSTDDHFYVDGVYTFNPDKLSEYHQKTINQVEKLMKNWEDFYHDTDNSNIVVHNTFTQEWEMEPYLDLADKYGFKIFTIIVEKRHKNDSKHNVPFEIIKKQRARFSVKL